MKNQSLFLLLFMAFIAQAQTQDSLIALKEVVLTGQFEPQSLKKSVHNVRIISRKDIENQAATNLADVLNQYLNITIIPDSGTGQSTVSMFGLDGSYFKILIDNIPIVSNNSMGNSIDLTQINLDDIEQIEIIEGSMGVTHGANAVSGILNIITKKKSKYKWQINSFIQEETVGEEYGLFNKGRHIQSLKISNQISEHWFASLGVNRNDFRGFLDDKKGIDHQGSDLQRGFTWLPRNQVFTNATINYQKDRFRMFYKFDFLDETIDFFNPSVFSIANPPFGVDFFANDARFLTQRFFHHLNATGDLFQLKYNISVSHQKQTRTNENFRYNFQNQNEENIQKVKNIETDILYSSGTFINFIKNKKYDFQLGYEFVNTQGFALVDGENQTKVEVNERLENYDVFAVSEINPTDRFSIRPGVRVSLQSYFDTQYASSLGLKYLFPKDYETRLSVGRSFRVPTFDELFSKIKFSGHQFFGNENLKPEQSMSYELSAKKRFIHQNKTLESRLSFGFLDVNDRIEMAFVGLEDNTPVYQFININSYQMWNMAWQQSLQVGKWNANAGAILVGVSQVIDDGEAVSDDRFLYNFNFNASLNYEMTRWQTLFSVYYKYNGVQQQFQRAAENGVATYRLSEIEGFSFMDASVRKSFSNKKFEVTLGARNLLNVTRINQGFSGEAHSAGTALVLGYGRSYFLKLLFNLNI